MAKTPVKDSKKEDEKEREPISIGDMPTASRQEPSDEERKNRLRAAEQRLEDAKNMHIQASKLEPGDRRFMDDLRTVAQSAGVSMDEMHQSLKDWVIGAVKKRILKAEDDVKANGGKVLKPGETDEKAKQQAINEAKERATK